MSRPANTYRSARRAVLRAGPRGGMGAFARGRMLRVPLREKKSSAPRRVVPPEQARRPQAPQEEARPTIERLTNWQRNRWAAAGYPQDPEKIASFARQQRP